MDCGVCFGDCLIFAKCIIFCVHWLSGFQTPILTVANKLHIYYLKQIIGQWIVWSALVTASYLLIVLSSVFTGYLDFRLIYLQWLHIYYLKQIIGQWIVWSALVTASYLLSVLSSVFSTSTKL